MAHEIDRFARAHGTRRAWHGLGRELPEGATVADAREACFPWELRTLPLFCETGETVRGYVRLCRSDGDGSGRNPLAVVSEQYQPLKNAVLQECAEAFDLPIETAASLRRGRTVYFLLRCCEAFERITDQPGDVLHPYVLLANDHDGSGAVRAFATTIRVVCANTLRLADAGRAGGFRFRHTGAGLDTRTVDASRALAGTMDLHRSFAEWARRAASLELDTRPVTPAMYFRAVSLELEPAATPERVERLVLPWHDRLATEAGTSERSTLWQAFNAVTEAADYTASRGRAPSVNSRLFGGRHAVKAAALKVAKVLVP